jgi:DNA-binding protein YbaB
MFDNLKKLAELKKMQDSFKKEKLTIEKNGVSVTINGNMEIEEVKLNPELNLETQQDLIKKCFNEAKENIQKTLAKSLMGSRIGF